MQNQPLFSFCILSYNNYKYMFEALDSLFRQTYPNIELLISNDASPDFDMAELTQYINDHKRENIRHVFLNDNKTNLGTVRNVELVRSEAKGEYIMYMAADDALYDENVLQRFADEFEERGKEAMVLCGKVAMCGHELDDIADWAPDSEGIRAIKTMTCEQMFSRLTHTFTIPTTSTAYRMSVYDKVGPYDEDYFIIEDAPLFIRLAREGIKVHWIDDFIAARHRDGGISHGNTLNLSEGYRRYRYDEITFFKKEVLPYKNRILPQDLKHAMDKWAYIQQAYDKNFVEPFLTPRQRLMRKAKHIPSILLNLLQRLWQQVPALLLSPDIRKELAMLSIGGVLVLLMGNVFMALTVFLFPIGIPATLWVQVSPVFAYLAIVCASIWVALGIYKLVYSVYRALRFVLIGR